MNHALQIFKIDRFNLHLYHPTAAESDRNASFWTFLEPVEFASVRFHFLGLVMGPMVVSVGSNLPGPLIKLLQF